VALDEKLLKYSVASTKSYLESVLEAIPIGAAILEPTPPPLPVILIVPFTVKSPVQYITKPLQARNGLNNKPPLMVKFLKFFTIISPNSRLILFNPAGDVDELICVLLLMVQSPSVPVPK
jgi:hypothetical protein